MSGEAAESSLVQLDADEFARVAAASDGCLLVAVMSPWCQPCARMHPVLESLAADPPPGVLVAMVDLSVDPGLAESLGVRSTPTTVVVRAGVVVARAHGARTSQQLVELLHTAT